MPLNTYQSRETKANAKHRSEALTSLVNYLANCRQILCWQADWQLANGIHVFVSTWRLCGLKAKYKHKYSSLKVQFKAKYLTSVLKHTRQGQGQGQAHV